MRLRFHRRAGLALTLALAASLLLLTQVLSFSEEGNLWFIDPEDQQPYFAEGVSSVQFDLLGALAECAGFTTRAANTLAIYAQLTDSDTLADGKYSLCGRRLPTAPQSTQVCNGQDLLRSWPLTDTAQEGAGCFTSRFGPFAPFFHFAHASPTELGAIQAWAAGETSTLRGQTAFAWGTAPLNLVVNPTCIYTPTVEIDTGSVRAGSTEAFGVYLGALGDSWSHKDCLAQLDAAGVPWGMITNDPRFPACSTAAQLREFGPSNPDTERTEQGILALYAALEERSRARAVETAYYPIPLTAHDNHLSQAIDAFVHTWPTLDPTGVNDYPRQRRANATEIRQWCAVTRAQNPTYLRFRWASFLPSILRADSRR